MAAAHARKMTMTWLTLTQMTLLVAINSVPITPVTATLVADHPMPVLPLHPKGQVAVPNLTLRCPGSLTWCSRWPRCSA
jgi:hypothetical protein